MLRPYQTTAIESALQALTRSGSAVMQMPTGAGKTKAATEIVQRANKPVWFVCHRQEIIRQTSEHFTAAGIAHGIISPRHAQTDDVVQIASVQTLANRIADLPKPRLVIWDECHHVAAKSWAKIRDALPDAEHLGLTATPERLDGKGLDKWFAELVVGPSIKSLTPDYLSPFRYFAPSEPDLRSAKLQAGDYRKSDLEKAMNTPVLIGDAVGEYRKHTDGKRALVFCASVEASRAVVERFNAEGVLAAHVDGSTPDDARKAAVADLEAGRIKVLSNVEVFTEGFDLPAIDVVILLRPTKSLALFLQMIGRGLRTAEGKDHAVVFDHAGLWLDHGQPDAEWAWSLGGGARRERIAGIKAGGERQRRCPECKEVRVEQVETCRCGYEFPTGREIGEYDGVLHELRSAVPEGFTTASDLARDKGVTIGAVRAWSRRGLPYSGGLVPLEAAEKWLSENVDMATVRQRQAQMATPSSGMEKQREFARRYGVTASTVNVWAKKGLPTNEVGFVKSDSADDWVVENINLETSRVRSSRSSTTDGFLNLKAFERRHGRPGCGQSWVKCGLPIAEHGVPVEDGDSWVAMHIATNGKASNKIEVASDGSMNRTGFARLARIGLSRVAIWARRGMPTTQNGRIMPDEAKEWAGKNIKDAQVYPFWLDNSDEFEQRKQFARRVGTSQNTVSHWAARGLPCSSNGWVHIAPALKWVEDHPHFNRRFTIPPEAWPADNDNQASQPRAAQAA
jgi:DNA repair protein RadD